MDDDELINEFEKRVKEWADSYDAKSSYTQGKIVGGIHTITILKNILQEDDQK